MILFMSKKKLQAIIDNQVSAQLKDAYEKLTKYKDNNTKLANKIAAIKRTSATDYKSIESKISQFKEEIISIMPSSVSIEDKISESQTEIKKVFSVFSTKTKESIKKTVEESADNIASKINVRRIPEEKIKVKYIDKRNGEVRDTGETGTLPLLLKEFGLLPSVGTIIAFRNRKVTVKELRFEFDEGAVEEEELRGVEIIVGEIL